MADNFQFSGAHKFFVGIDSSDAGKPSLSINATIQSDGTPEPNVSGPVTINTLVAAGDLSLYKNIRDVSESGSNNSVNITTRADAELGLSVEVIATTTKSMTTEILYKPNDHSDGSVQDLIYKQFLLASIQKKEIFMVDLDGDYTAAGVDGVIGFASNWTVALSSSKPVEGVVTATANLSSSSKGQYVIWNDSATEFRPLS